VFHSARDFEEELPQNLAKSLLGSCAAHVLIGVLVVCVLSLHPPEPSLRTPPLLGFLGKTHWARDLEVIEPNSLRFYFYQPTQRGTAGSPGPRAFLLSPRAGEHNPQRPSREGVRHAQPQAELARGPARAGKGSGRDASGQGGAAATEGGLQGSDAQLGLHRDVPYAESLIIQRLVKPVYPELELSRRIGARLVIVLHVSPEGDIDDQHVQEAKTDPPGNPTRSFELVALEALQQWRVRLPRSAEYAQGYWLTVPIEFRPEDKDFGSLDHLSVP